MGLEVIGATTSAIATASNLGGGVAGAVGGIFGGLSGLSLPSPNILSKYASYDYVISLSVLTIQDFNYPDISYKAGKVLPLICKSAGANPDNRVATAYGKSDFFIDNVTFDSIIGLATAKTTSVTTVQFDVFEPYSIGTFILACQTAAYQAKHENFRDAPYLLTIEFRGNTENGAISNIPFAARHIPIRLTTVSMKASEQGCRYNINAYATQGQALTTQYANLKTDTTIKGKTVQELLQTGDQSLQSVVNKKLEEYVTNKTVAVADKIVILFPQEDSIPSATVATAGGGSDKKTKATAAPTQVTGDSAEIFKKLGISETTLTQSSGAVNELGAADMGWGTARRSDPAGADEGLVVSEDGNSWSRGKMVANPKEGTLKFSQEMDIPSVINQVLLTSSYPDKALSAAGLKADSGMRVWWRIDTQVYMINSKENLSKTGTYPRIIVYRILPYEAHSSKVTVANGKATGFDKLSKGIVKRYDYMYTGNNSEVIKFNIDFSVGFANKMAADRFKNSQDVKNTGGKASDKKEDKKDIAPFVDGNKPPVQAGSFGTQVTNDGLKTWFDGWGGGGQETEANRAARVFHDAITKSADMTVLELEIWGDPYWIVNSGMGNYTSKPVKGVKDLNKDGSVNWQTSEVDIWVYFRSPLDINQGTGMYDFKSPNHVEDMSLSSKAGPAIGFSGLYCVTTITNNFNKGQFRQTLKGFRRNGQEYKAPANPNQTLNVNTPATGANK